MVFFQDWFAGTFNDWFSWEIYDMLPKSGAVDIFGLSNQFIPKKYSAWHDKRRGIQFHSRKYILLRSIYENKLENVKEVIDNNFDLSEEIDLKYGFTALSLAAILNRTAILQYLHLRGADQDQKDRTGNTPLMHAVKNWNFDSVKLLVEKCNSNLNITDLYGQTAKDKAEFKKLHAIVSYLEQKEQEQKQSDEIYNKIYNTNQSASEQKGAQKKSKQQIEKENQQFLELEKQIHFKQFPKFNIEFGFEKTFQDTFIQKQVKEKKILNHKALRYPFNNFKGTYRVSFMSYYFVNEIEDTTTLLDE